MTTLEFSSNQREALHQLYEENRFLDAYSSIKDLWSPQTDLSGLSPEDLVFLSRLANRLGSSLYRRLLLREAERRAPDNPMVRVYTIGENRRHRMTELDQLRVFEETPRLESGDAELDSLWIAHHANQRAYLRDFEIARREIEIAIELFDDPWILSSKAYILFRQDLWDEARVTAQQAWDKSPGRAFSSSMLSSIINAQEGTESAALLLLKEHFRSKQSYELLDLGIRYSLGALERGKGTKIRELIPGSFKELITELHTLSPIADRRHRASFEYLQAWAAKIEDRREDLKVHAEKTRSYFYKKISEHLQKNPEGNRHVLPHNPVRQKENTCLPSSLLCCASAFGVELDHDQLVQEMTYGGTASWRALEWAEQQGWTARPFIGDEETAKTLLRQGMPFMFIQRSLGNSHAVAAVGIDEGLGTIIYHDPSMAYIGEMLLSGLRSGEAPLGPECIAFAPPTHEAQLKSVPLKGEAFLATRIHYQKLRETGTREDVQKLFQAALKEPSFTEAERLYLEGLQARYAPQPQESLEKFKQLYSGAPECHLAQREILDAARALRNTALQRETLKAIVLQEPAPGFSTSLDKIYPEAVLVTQYADIISQSAENTEEAIRLLNKAIFQNSSCALAYHVLADILALQGRVKESHLPYRISSCLEEEDDHYADAYAWCLRKLGKRDEGIQYLKRRKDKVATDAGGGGAWRVLISRLESFGYPQEALDTTLQGLKERPSDGELASFAVDFLSKYGRFKEAESALEICQRESSGSLYQSAATLLAKRKGQNHDEKNHAEAWVKEAPGLYSARQALVDQTIKSSGLQAAQKLVEKWREAEPKNEIIEEIYLNLLDRLSERDLKIQILEDRVKNNPFDAWAWRELAWDLRLIALKASKRTLDKKRDRFRKVVEQATSTSSEDDPSAIALKGELALIEEKYNEALDYFEKAFLSDPDYSYSVRRWFDSVIYLPKEERENRKLKFAQAIDEAFVSHTAQLGQAREIALCLAERLDLNRTLESIETWRKSSPDDPYVDEAWADVQLSYGAGVKTAKTLVDRLKTRVQEHPLHSGLVFSLADTYKLLGQKEDAIQTYRDLLKFNPLYTSARLSLISALEQNGEHEAALGELQEALRLDPDDSDLYSRLYKLYLDQKEPELAIKALKDGIHQCPNSMHLWEDLISLLYDLGQKEEAIQVARTLEKRYPDGAYAILIVARAFNRQPGAFSREEIENQFKKSLRLNYRLWDAVWAYCNFLKRHSKHDACDEVLDHYREVTGDHERATTARGVLAMENDETTEALEIFRLVLEDYPNSEWAWSSLLTLIEDWDKPDEVLEILHKIPPNLLNDLDFAVMRLEHLERVTDDVESFLSEWEELSQNFPTTYVVQLNYFDTLIRCERPEQAEKVLEQISRLRKDSAPYITARWIQLYAEKRDRPLAVKHIKDLFYYQGDNMPQSSDIAWKAIQGAGWTQRATEEGIAALRKGKRIYPAFFDDWLRVLAKNQNLDRLEDILALLQPSRQEWETLDYYVKVLNHYVEEGGAQAILGWAKQNDKLCREETQLWQIVGRAYILKDLNLDAYKWMENWREHPQTQHWAMSNFASACLGLNKFEECAEACKFALENQIYDFASDNIADSYLFALSMLGREEDFLEEFHHYRGLMESGATPDETIQMYEVLAEIYLEEDEDEILRILKNARTVRKSCEWARPALKLALKNRLSFWKRILAKFV